MFKGMRNRVWLGRVAQHECFSRLTRLDDRTFGKLLHDFEQELTARGMWPFNSPEELALHFSVWFDKRPESRIVVSTVEKAPSTPRPLMPAEPASEPAAPRSLEQKPNVRRNELCPCGSGQKYKHCCGRIR